MAEILTLTQKARIYRKWRSRSVARLIDAVPDYAYTRKDDDLAAIPEIHHQKALKVAQALGETHEALCLEIGYR